MIDRGVPNGDDWPEGVLDSLRAWEQGDLVAGPPFFYFADPQRPVWEGTRQYTDTSTEPEVILPDEGLCPPYGMVTTQTCEIAEEGEPSSAEAVGPTGARIRGDGLEAEKAGGWSGSPLLGAHSRVGG
jgi:hypothetical protein